MPAHETTSLGWGVGAREGGEDVPGGVSHASSPTWATATSVYIVFLDSTSNLHL